MKGPEGWAGCGMKDWWVAEAALMGPEKPMFSAWVHFLPAPDKGIGRTRHRIRATRLFMSTTAICRWVFRSTICSEGFPVSYANSRLTVRFRLRNFDVGGGRTEHLN